MKIEFWPDVIFQNQIILILVIIFSAVLIYLLKSLLKKKSSLVFTSEKIVDPQDIELVLQTGIKQKSQFIIQLNGRGRAFNSSLLAIGSRHLTIDAVFPEEGNELIEDSRFIKIDFNVKEKDEDLRYIPYTLNSTYIKSEIYKGYPALSISYPDLINRNQKRNYLRVSPLMNEPVYIKFQMKGRQHHVKIDNISGGGIGFYTNLDKSALWLGQIINPLFIEFPDASVIECSGIVQMASQNDHAVIIDGKPQHYYCGIGFKNMDNPNSNRIIQYVIDRERRELRRLSREFE